MFIRPRSAAIHGLCARQSYLRQSHTEGLLPTLLTDSQLGTTGESLWPASTPTFVVESCRTSRACSSRSCDCVPPPWFQMVCMDQRPMHLGIDNKLRRRMQRVQFNSYTKLTTKAKLIDSLKGWTTGNPLRSSAKIARSSFSLELSMACFSTALTRTLLKCQPLYARIWQQQQQHGEGNLLHPLIYNSSAATSIIS